MAFFTSLAVGLFSFVWFGVVVGVPPEIATLLGLVMMMATTVAFALEA